MATTIKMTDLVAVAELETTDIFPVVQSSDLTSKKATIAQLLALIARPTELVVFDYEVDVSDGIGKSYFVVPDEFNGLSLSRIAATVITAGADSSSPPVNTEIQIYNITEAAYMLSTAMAIETGETSTRTSTQPGTIDPDHAEVSTGDVLRIDITYVSSTPPKGMILEMKF